MKQPLSLQRWLSVNIILLIVLCLTVVVFCFFGNPLISPPELFSGTDSVVHDLFFYARLPRLLLAVCVGAALSSSGVAFQSLLRNPLADPYILGVSGGAALGGVLALAFGLSFHWSTLLSFIFALGSLFFIYFIAQVHGRLPSHTLLLTGVIFNAFAFALILLVNALASVGLSHQIIYLLMGSLEAQSLESILWVSVLTFTGLFVLILHSKKMNLVSLGEESATQLGLDVEIYRKVLFFAASLMVGATVAISGLIGFVGLFVPHMMRLIVGTDHRLLVPASALAGGIFLILCDFLARTLLSFQSVQTELPVGVITALIGGPFFVYLLKRGSSD